MSGVLFVVMPFGAVESPAIGVSTIQVNLRRIGIPCTIAYLNILFAEALGYEFYREVNLTSGELFLGEWLFAQTLFPHLPHEEFLQDVRQKYSSHNPELMERLSGAAKLIPPFLDYCLRAVDWDRYQIIAFTSMFEQNLASLALARRVKERFPQKIVGLGGANCAGPMGLQLHRCFEFLDFVSTGEADTSFPKFAKALLEGGDDKENIRGYVTRNGKEAIDTGPACPEPNLDALPYPNYDDFYDQLRQSSLYGQMEPFLELFLETSRGCWWGQKQQCRFCGLNTQGLEFRSKSAERALDEILYLVTRYGIKKIMPVDNIIPLDYFKTLLPELRRRKLGIRLFYETKANLDREKINLFREAGVTQIQPGIEAFSRNILKLMRKGVSPLHNIQLLKWCRQDNIDAGWNLLFGFPGENYQDYQVTLDIVKSLTHLQPPMVSSYMRLHRFSPYFEKPEQAGIYRVRPLKAYRYLYPFPEEVLHNIAYTFEFDFDGKEKVNQWSPPLLREVELWQQKAKQSRLEVVFRTQNALVVRDTRPYRVCPEYRFGNPEKAIIEYCDDPKTFPALQQFLASSASTAPYTSKAAFNLQSFLDYLVRHRLMLKDEDQYLNLILLEQVGQVQSQLTVGPQEVQLNAVGRRLNRLNF